MHAYIKKLVTSLYHAFFPSICPFIPLSFNLSIGLTGCLTICLSSNLAALLSVHLFWMTLVEESCDFILKKMKPPKQKQNKKTVKVKKQNIISVGTFQCGGVMNKKQDKIGILYKTSVNIHITSKKGSWVAYLHEKNNLGGG